MSLLMISGILGLFFNRLSADDQYSLPKGDNLQQPLKMKLFQKKNVSEFFALYLISTWNFEHFKRKYDPHSLCISKIADYKRRG